MQGFRDSDDRAADNDLVGELGHLPGPDGADPGHAPKRSEDIGQSGDIVLCATRHDRKRAVARTGLAA